MRSSTEAPLGKEAQVLLEEKDMSKLIGATVVLFVLTLLVSGCAKVENFELLGKVSLGQARTELPNVHMKGKDGAIIDTAHPSSDQGGRCDSHSSNVSTSSGSLDERAKKFMGGK
jgi:hypothetical protein